MPTLPKRPITVDALAGELATFVFWVFAAVALINFNDAAHMMLPTGRFVAAGLVALALALIVFVPKTLRESLGSHGLWMVAALATFFLIGGTVAILREAPWQQSDPYNPVRPLFAIVLIVGSAQGAAAVLARIGASRFLAGLLLLLGTMAGLVLVTPWLIEHVYVHLTALERAWIHRANRHFGTFINPNMTGMAACCAFVLAVATLAHSSSRGRRALGAAVAVVSMVAALLTLSRTAVATIALLIAVFFAASAPPRGVRSRHWFGLKVFLAALVGLLVLVYLSRHTFGLANELARRFLGMDIVAGGGLNKRLELLQYGFNMAMEAPLFGNGLTTLGWMVPAKMVCQTAICGCHNAILQFWGEAGVVPALLLVTALAVGLARARRLPRSLAADTAFGWLLVFTITCMFADGVPYHLWFSSLFGLTSALLAHAAREAAPRSAAAPAERRRSSV